MSNFYIDLPMLKLESSDNPKGMEKGLLVNYTSEHGVSPHSLENRIYEG